MIMGLRERLRGFQKSHDEKVEERVQRGEGLTSRWREWKKQRAEEGAYKKELRKEERTAFKEAYKGERVAAMKEAAQIEARAAAKAQAQQEARRYMPRSGGAFGGGERIAGQIGQKAAGVSQGIGDLFGWNQPQGKQTRRPMPLSVFGEPTEKQKWRGPGLSGRPGLPGLFKGTPPKQGGTDLFGALDQLTAPLRKGQIPMKEETGEKELIIRRGGKIVARVKQ